MSSTNAIPAIKACSHALRKGFSLVELSIVLAILGVVTAGGLSVGTTVVEQQANIASNAQLDTIDKAIQDFYQLNGYLPCPADPTVALGGAGFGVPVGGGTCTAAGAISNTTDTGTARIGALPTRALGLRDRSLADEFGNRYTYAVTKLHTNAASFTTNPGTIIVIDGSGNTIVSDSSYVVLSNGADGKGARRYQTATTPVACGAGMLDVENCNADATFRDARFNNGNVAASFYDDFIRWLPKFRLTNTTAASALWQQNGTSIYYNAGNVGVGTNTPSTKFVINGPADGTGAPFTGGVPLLRIQGSNSAWSEPSIDFAELALSPIARISAKNTASGAGDLIFSTRLDPSPTVSERMRILSSGNVGIGSTMAGSRLVVSRATAGNSADWTAQFTAGAQWTSINPNSSAGSWTPLAQNGDSVYLYSQGGGDTGALTIAQWSGSPRGIRISSTGDVGVGVSSPAAKLDVAGEVKISSTGLGCGAGTVGALRYTAGIIQYCNGTSWAAMGSSLPEFTGRICVFYNTACPAGWTGYGEAGYLYKSSAGATCPFGGGASYPGGWNWCHPQQQCCRG